MKKIKSIRRAIKRRNIYGYFNANLKIWLFYRLTKRGVWIGYNVFAQKDMNIQPLSKYEMQKIMDNN